MALLGRVSLEAVEAAVLNADPPIRVSQNSIEVLYTFLPGVRFSDISAEVVVSAVPPAVPVVIDEPCSFAARYFVNLYNQAGLKVAIFDDWIDLEYGVSVDGLGYYAMTLRGNDSRRSLFELDGMIEVWRSIPGVGLTWYRDFVGLHRTYTRTMNERGEVFVISSGLDLNDFLGRTDVKWKATSPQAAKDDYTETVMKAFVEENCGPSALYANGRLRDGVLPNFSIATDTSAGPNWAGDRAYENLLDILHNLANFSSIDFQVVATGYPAFEFRTYPGQLGVDRTVGNLPGNQPLVFSPEYGNVISYVYSKNRSSEVNVVTIIGAGEAMNRDTFTLATTAVFSSPWNRRETTRPGNSQDGELEFAAVEALVDLQQRETLDFIPRQQLQTLYGFHYDIGDRVTVIEDDISMNKRILSKKIRVGQGKEDISLDFGDVL